MAWLRLAFAVSLALALAAPAVVYATYPGMAAEAVEAASEAPQGAPSPAGALGGLGGVYASLEALRGYRGHVQVAGVVERSWMHMALLRVDGGRVLVTLMGCWDAGGRVVWGYRLAAALRPGVEVYVYGHYMETHMGPVLVAERLEAPGLGVAVRVDCPQGVDEGMHGPGWGHGMPWGWRHGG